MADLDATRHIKEQTMAAKSNLSTGLAMASAVLLGTCIVSASAEPRRDEHGGGDHRGDRGHERSRGGGYNPAPPVVYGAPAYYPPPVVYGPAVGIVLPGIAIGIR
jgi:hypothetical protein